MAESTDEYTCAVDTCDYSHESKNSMYGHSLNVHNDRYAWERDEDGSTDEQSASTTSSQPSSGDDDLPPPPSEVEVETDPGTVTQSPPTPTDVLERVLETDPKLSDAQAEWLMEWAELEAPIDTSKLRDLCTELGTNKTTKKRLQNRYTSAVNATLQKNPDLVENTNWALFLTKETGQPHYYQQARTQDTRDAPQVQPPPMANGGTQQQPPQVQPPGQPNQQPPQAGGVNPPNQPGQQAHQQPYQQANHQPGVQPNQQATQQDQTDPEIEQLRKTQEKMLNFMAEQVAGDDDDPDPTATLSERLREVAEVQQQMEKLSGDDDQMQELRKELRELRKEAAQQTDGGGDPMTAMAGSDGMGALAMLAASDDHDVDPETLTTLAEVFGETDSDVKIKEMELEKEEKKWDRIADAFENISDGLSGAAGGAVSTLVKSMAEDSDETDDDTLTPEDIKQMRDGQPNLRPADQQSQTQPQQPAQNTAYAAPQEPQQEPGHLSTADAPGTNEPPKALQEEQQQEQPAQPPGGEPEPGGEPAHLSGDGASENQTPHMSVYDDPVTNGEPESPEPNGDRPAEPQPADEPAVTEGDPALRSVEDEGGD